MNEVWNININKAEKKLQKAKDAYENAQVAYRWKIEDKVEVKKWVKEDKWLGDLKWDWDAILKFLKSDKKYVDIKENVEMMWYKWKKVKITLPAVWNFKGYKFSYFVSDDLVTKRDFEMKPKLEKKSYSMNDISKLLKAMNGFMATLGCETDWGMKYKNELKYWETNTYRCSAWNCLKAITWLDSWYWLSDKNVAWRKNSRAKWYCDLGNCYFYRGDNDNYSANLFLRSSA